MTAKSATRQSKDLSHRVKQLRLITKAVQDEVLERGFRAGLYASEHGGPAHLSAAQKRDLRKRFVGTRLVELYVSGYLLGYYLDEERGAGVPARARKAVAKAWKLYGKQIARIPIER